MEDRFVDTGNIQYMVQDFWEQNSHYLQDILHNKPPIFYHSYPNVEVPIASFNTIAKEVPSLLHHDLGRSKLTPADEFLQRLKSFQPMHTTFLVGGKGCGKTRTLFEILAQNFGFYFKGSKVVDGESKDYTEIMQMLRCNEFNVDKPENVEFDAVCCAVISRCLILHKCLELKPDFSPLEWLILQTRCERDRFSQLTLRLITRLSSGVPEGRMIELLEQVYKKMSKTALPCGKLLFVIDEAQANIQKSSKLKVLLPESLKVFHAQSNVPTATILAGTGIELLTEAYEMKEGAEFDIVEASETYETASGYEAFSDYVSGFIGPGDYRGLFERYYRSRAGTIASGLHHYINKRIPREKSTEFLLEFGSTLATRGGAQLGIPNSLYDTLNLLNSSDRYMSHILREVTESYYLGGKGYIFTHNSSMKLVEMGIATMKLVAVKVNPQEIVTREAALNKHSVPWDYPASALVSERYVQAALCYRFIPKLKMDILERFQGVQTDTECASYFEKYCPVFVHDIFSRDESLEKAFTNTKQEHSDSDLDTVPVVEDSGIPHVEYGPGEEVSLLAKERVKLAPPPAGVPLMVRLGHNWTIERWLNEGSGRPTFLQTKTDNQFGPDFLAILEMPRKRQELLLSIQVRTGMDPNRMDPRKFFTHNKQREVLERNRQNVRFLEKYWKSGWVELLIAPYTRLPRDERPFPSDVPCIRTSVDKSNLYRMFPKLLNYARRR